MKIFFFGGTFDPPHLGHKKIVDICLNNCDKLIIIPNKNSIDKNIITNTYHRLNMLNLLFDDSRIKIDEFEINSKLESYTYHTIDYLKSKYCSELTMVIGYDQLINFKNWFKYEEILHSVHILCFKRKISKMHKLNQFNQFKNVKYIEDFNCDVSSSSIRSRLINLDKKNYNQNLDIDDKVLKYIITNKLYES